ncbi:MAG: HD-GYP domain-containing protein [Tuberibacillus sp.]
MKVNRVDLVPGCVLSSDIYVKSTTPIMTKKTVLSKEHIDVLKAFLVDTVEVEPVLENGEAFKPSYIVNNNKKQQDHSITHVNPFVDTYLQGVFQYKQLFETWQQGKNIDIFKVVSFLNPLIDKFISHPTELMKLYQYSGSKDYIFHHSVSVGLLSAYFSTKLNYSKKEVFEIGMAGLLADCGMAKLPPRLYEKPNQLMKKEFFLLEKHPVYSYQMLKDLPTIKEGVMLGVLQHHERLDGSGYPLRLKNDKLHPYGKLIAVFDVFHAMICIRPYRPRQSLYKVLELMNQDQFGKFDHKILSLLIDEIAHLSVGTRVKLSNHEIGEIVFTDRMQPTRPIVRLENGATIALSHNRELFIEDVLS